MVAQMGLEEVLGTEDEQVEGELLFPVESHLRDFIANNIDAITVNVIG